MPALFYLPPMLLLGPAIAAMLVYAVLRWVIWAPGAGTSPQPVAARAVPSMMSRSVPRENRIASPRCPVPES